MPYVSLVLRWYLLEFWITSYTLNIGSTYCIYLGKALHFVSLELGLDPAAIQAKVWHAKYAPNESSTALLTSCGVRGFTSKFPFVFLQGLHNFRISFFPCSLR